MCHQAASSYVNRVIRETTNSLDSGAHTARTLVQSGKGGTGALDLHGDLFPLGRGLRTKGQRQWLLPTLPRTVAAESREPVGGGPAVAEAVARAWALLHGLQASRVGGFRKAARGRAASPRACGSYEAVASPFGAGRELPSAGRGRARRWGRSLLAAATQAGPEGSGGGSSGDDEALGGWFILCEHMPFHPWARRFCACFRRRLGLGADTHCPRAPALGTRGAACLASAAPFPCSCVCAAF